MFVVSLRRSLASISTLLEGVSLTALEGDEFKRRIEPNGNIADDVSKFGMHDIESGAAFNLACGRIPGDLLNIHAGWTCPSLKLIQIKYTIDARLSLSRALLLYFNCSRIFLFL